MKTQAEQDYDRGVKAYQSDDNKNALKWYLKSAEQGYSKAQCDLGTMYYGEDDIPQDHSKAFKWYSKASEQGNAMAHYNLSLMYYRGEHVAKDLNKARALAELAVSNGFNEAKEALAIFEAEIASVDIGESLKNMEQYLESGDRETLESATKEMREMLANLDEKEKNMLDILEEAGKPVKKYSKLTNTSHEVFILRNSATNQKNAEAQYELGLLSSQGQVITQNHAEALRWYLKAAKQGHAEAQASIGAMYILGNGVAKDLIQAYMWLSIALDNGNSKVIKLLLMIEEKITPAEMEEAKEKKKRCIESNYKDCGVGSTLWKKVVVIAVILFLAYLLFSD